MNPHAAYGCFPEPYWDGERSKVVIVPVPYGATCTWQKGTERGPQALLDASVSLEFYDIETGYEAYREGIHTDNPVACPDEPGAMVAAVEQRVLGHLRRGKFVVTIGGEHSVSIGAIAAHARHRRGFSILQLDAHSDLREEYEGSRFNHACAMARAREYGPLVQVGIRSMDRAELPALRDHPVFFAERIVDGGDGWMDEVLAALQPRVYVTVDLDVFDPAIMPSTGTPEPGGLEWYPVLRLLRRIAQQRELAGFDIVELCPNPHNKAPDFLAAKLVYKLLTYHFAGRAAPAHGEEAT